MPRAHHCKGREDREVAQDWSKFCGKLVPHKGSTWHNKPCHDKLCQPDLLQTEQQGVYAPWHGEPSTATGRDPYKILRWFSPLPGWSNVRFAVQITLKSLICCISSWFLSLGPWRGVEARWAAGIADVTWAQRCNVNWWHAFRVADPTRATYFANQAELEPMPVSSTWLPQCCPSPETSGVEVDDDDGRNQAIHEQGGNSSQDVFLQAIHLHGKWRYDELAHNPLNGANASIES